VSKKKVLFARVTAEAHDWAIKKAKRSKGRDISASVIVERLLMNDKRKQQARRATA
jgi:hypothetical protein